VDHDDWADGLPADAVALNISRPEPVDARLAAWFLCRHFEDIDHPTAADVSRWAQLIRLWRSRHKDKIKVYGRDRSVRLYVLAELEPFAQRWREWRDRHG
jgi:hypothetical protein